MRRYEIVEKSVGETPLQALEAFRERERLGGIPLTYAGRLDPMASGKLLILIGDECKKRDTYTGLDKRYRFEVLFGARTDTGDILGITERTVTAHIASACQKLDAVNKTQAVARALQYKLIGL